MTRIERLKVIIDDATANIEGGTVGIEKWIQTVAERAQGEVFEGEDEAQELAYLIAIGAWHCGEYGFDELRSLEGED